MQSVSNFIACPDTGTLVRHTNPENKEADALLVNLLHDVSDLCVLWLIRAQLSRCVVCILALCLTQGSPHSGYTLCLVVYLGKLHHVHVAKRLPECSPVTTVRQYLVFSLYNNSYIYTRYFEILKRIYFKHFVYTLQRLNAKFQLYECFGSAGCIGLRC